jgi:uncharacterized protein
MILDSLYIKDVLNKGRGIFTTKKIMAGTIVEIAAVIVMPNIDRIHLDKTLLHDYIFEWGYKKEECAMALGMIPIYNHSYESNCDYYMDYDAHLMMIKSVRDIDVEEELCINYNGDWDNDKKLWFDAL